MLGSLTRRYIDYLAMPSSEKEVGLARCCVCVATFAARMQL